MAVLAVSRANSQSRRLHACCCCLLVAAVLMLVVEVFVCGLSPRKKKKVVRLLALALAATARPPSLSEAVAERKAWDFPSVVDEECQSPVASFVAFEN